MTKVWVIITASGVVYFDDSSETLAQAIDAAAATFGEGCTVTEY